MQARAKLAKIVRALRERLIAESGEPAAFIWLNRLVTLRLLEGMTSRPAPRLTGGEGDGWAFDELAVDMPGLFGAESSPIAWPTLRDAIADLDDPELASCWSDDMTLGWVYQYWNDPDRERLDVELAAGGKLAASEIASKTQMFTERYGVDWLVQNGLGRTWMAICAKQGWTAKVVADGTLARLDARRADWRAQRVAGAVEPTELMPLHSDEERRWAYYVEQPMPADAPELAPESVRAIKLIDPAVGSGHFLVVALEFLVGLHREEAEQRGELGQPQWSDQAIVESILANNLYGIDLDPRAVQIAAAALLLVAQRISPQARPRRINLVASRVAVAGLSNAGLALADLGISAQAAQGLVRQLAEADHLGSLLKIGHALDEALEPNPTPDRARRLLLRVETALAVDSDNSADLGLRLAEQLPAGVRFVRMLEENTYDLVVGNPPYLATAKLADARYVRKHYALGKADLVAAFMIRGVELARPGGMSALLTMRNWMFLNQYSGLRKWLMETQDLRALHDLSSGAFEGIHAGKVVVSVVSSIVRKGPAGGPALALRVFEAGLLGHDETARKRSATLCQAGRSEFDPAALRVVPDWPLVYDWGLDDLDAYRNLALLGAQSPARQGLATANNARFLRKPWEVSLADGRWAPYIKGAAGRAWLASVDDVVLWADEGLEIEFFEVAGRPASRPQNREFYFRLGIAFSAIGTEFCARAHRSPAVFGNAGLSVFPGSPIELAQTLCSLNSTRSRRILESLNPTVNFLVGDVNRLPRFVVEHATEIVAVLAAAFAIHERHREPSIEFEQPGPSPWRHAQAWAQLAVDRPANTPLPAYERQFDGEPATDHLSFALGCALGRFESQSALPHGLLVLDGTLGPDPGEASTDSLGHPGSASLHRAWSEHATKLGSTRKRLRDYLRLEAFAGHRTRYENRPIHWPLSSANKTFVAWVTIRHLQAGTIRHLLAEFLHPILQRLDAELAEPRLTPRAQKRPEQVRAWRAELATFIADLSACAERGPPPPDATTPARTDDAAYEPDLDDGVRINAAALWPVLDPQWKDPKSWWKELARAEGRKDCDWSKLAARYFAARVDAKCRAEPSLALAHGCAEKYHPDRARAWALWRAKHAGHRT